MQSSCFDAISSQLLYVYCIAFFENLNIEHAAKTCSGRMYYDGKKYKQEDLTSRFSLPKISHRDHVAELGFPRLAVD